MDPYQQPQNQPTTPPEPNGFPAAPQPSTESFTSPQPATQFAPAQEPELFAPANQPSAEPMPAAPGFSQQPSTEPAPAPAAPSFAAQPAAPLQGQADDPGKTLGIISIVLIFFFAPVAIILGVISRKKSKAAGHSTTLGTVGMIGGIVATVLNILVAVVTVSIIAAGVNEIKNSGGSTYSGSSTLDMNNDQSTSTTKPTVEDEAKQVKTLAEAYKAQAGDYPKTRSDFTKYPGSTPPSDLTFYTAIRSNSSATYVYCGQGSAQVQHLGTSKEDVRILALGTASATAPCL